MRWSLIATWIVFSIMIYIIYMVSTVDLEISVRRVEYYQGYHAVKIYLQLVNRGQNFLAPSTTLEILGTEVRLGRYLAPGDSASISVVVPLNSSEKVVLSKDTIHVRESIDIYSSLWYFIQHLPQQLVSSLR